MANKENELVKARNKMYNDYVKQVTPTHNCAKNCLKAFITGGIICTIGQAILNGFINAGVPKDEAALWNTMLMILLSVILTCLNVYPFIVKWGGAGALVPITGFANGVCAPAMEFKREGWVFGTGARIFSIGGPVILYGIFTSWLLGVIYFILQVLGVA